MLAHLLTALALASNSSVLAAQDAPPASEASDHSLKPNEIVVVDRRQSRASDDLVLPLDHIVQVVIDGVPLRLLVTADAPGPIAVNPTVAVDRKWRATSEILWDYGDGKPLRSGVMRQRIDFGDRSVIGQVMWSFDEPTSVADGLIGVHQLPYKRITFTLSDPIGQQTIQRFVMKRFGGREAERIGTDIDADGRELTVIFATNHTDNYIIAPMANYLASRFDGGFLPASEGVLTMRFGVQRRTRMMQLGRPLQIGKLHVDRFAVRLEDYGKARKVGEIGANDPRFDPNEIVVSRRKPSGRTDFLTRIGRSQIAHCSSLTYDLERGEILLACGAPPK